MHTQIVQIAQGSVMLSKLSSPAAMPIGDQSFVAQSSASAAPASAALVSRQRARLNWRAVGIIGISLIFLKNAVAAGQWAYGQGLTTTEATVVSLLTFFVPRITLWLIARI
jgi:hypothetical protein